jgi:hypothetical protein
MTAVAMIAVTTRIEAILSNSAPIRMLLEVI